MEENKVKEHFKRNRHRYGYTIFGGIALAGFTCLIMRGRHADVQRVSDGLEKVTVRSLSFLSNKQTVVNVIEREGRGHPGYMVRCLETNEGFPSQVAAAISVNAYPSVMSGHLQGKIPDVHGYHFERLKEVA